MPYQHREAEEKLIGLCIQHRDVFVKTADSLKAEDFSDPVYRLAYDEVSEIYLDGGHVETNELIERVQEKYGKPVTAVILRAIEEAVTPASTDWALKNVLSCSKKRFLEQSLTRICDRIGSADDVKPLFDELIRVATEGQHVKGQVYDGRATSERILERQARRRKSEDTIEGYRTGFKIVDLHLGGLVPKRLTILSGPSGHGKTAMSLNWLCHICIEGQVPGLFASLEMAPSDVEDRLVMMLSNSNSRTVKSGTLNTTIYEAVAEIKNGQLYVSDNHPRDIYDVSFLAEKYARVHGIKVLALDYVGEMVRDRVKFREDRDERFARWVKTIRDLAKRLDFHAVVVAQVNYEGALAESKKMQHIADAHLHFHREGTRHILECRKNRFGPSGHRYVIEFDRQTQRMTEEGIRKDDYRK